MEIQISLAGNPVTKKIASVATMFTTVNEVPRVMKADLDKGFVLMVGMRPLMGSREVMGSILYGRHWVSMNPKDPMFEDWLKHNLDMDARMVKVVTREEMSGMALVGNKYKDAYLEEEIEERLGMLEPTLRDLQGSPWSEIEDRIKKAHRQGLV